jgi:DNA-directed RNA polymerase subunit RPC12/RpoP
MAKKIKIIKCPQCGSLKNTLVRDDLYKCDHCRTDFILDNNDVNIVINEEQIYNSPATNLPGNNRKVIVVGSLIVIALFLLFILVPLFFLTPKNSGVGIISDNYSRNMLADLILTDRQSSKVHYMLAESRIYSVGYGEKQDSRTGFYLVFYDLISQKEEKSVFLEPLPSTKTGVECKIRAFEDGNTYIIVNRKKLMAVDPKKREVSAVPPALFGSYPELKSGVGNIDFTRSDDTDGFVIITNDGKLYNLYPLENKIYAKEELSEHIKTPDASKRKQQKKIP